MSKLIKSTISILAFSVGILLVFVIFFGQRANSDAPEKAAARDVGTNYESIPYEDEEPLLFYSLEDYEAYLCSLADDETVTYYYPESLPSDTSLKYIEVNKEGTIYYFNVARNSEPVFVETNNRDYDNVISMDNTDDTLFELFNTAIEKIYNLDSITNKRKYAENLAYAIGAELVYTNTSYDYYSGDLYADCYNNYGMLILVGSQKVRWESVGVNDVRIRYNYIPATLTEQEAAQLTDLTVHTVINTNNDQ